MSDIFGYIYACTVLTAGFWEYYKSKSFTFLGFDLVCGGALVCGAALDSEDPAKYILLLVTSIIVALVMAYRYFNSNRWLPSLVVVALSCVMFIQTGYLLIIRDLTQAFVEILKLDDEDLHPG
ncbi:uncharacterized protein CBL_08253 [Carabus blaptoides fortunei]